MYKKISIFITIFALVFGIQFLQPKNAFATIPVFDYANFTLSAQKAIVDGTNTAVNTKRTIWQFIKEEIAIPAIKVTSNLLLDKISRDTVNWANGGFDGEPGFINNWGDFIKGTQYNVISGAFKTATSVANQAQEKAEEEAQIKTEQCINNATTVYENQLQALVDLAETLPGLDTTPPDGLYDDYQIILEKCRTDNTASNISGNLGAIAQSNYNTFQSGEATNVRSNANTIANFGAKQLNIDALDSIIKGEGNTLKRLLGSQQKVNQFSNDITVGGWQGYIALADPHNYSSGLSSLVISALGSKTTTKVSQTIDDLQTPLKFLDKKSCSGGGKLVDGKCPRGEKAISQTPGQIVGDKVTKSLNFKEDSLGDILGLEGAITTAMTTIVDGLASGGFNTLTQQASVAFFGQNEQATFGGNYQSEYDVLGITRDLTEAEIYNDFNGGDFGESGGNIGINGGGGNISTEGEIAIGGPEDLNSGINNSSQFTINLEDLLEKNIFASELERSHYIGIKELSSESAVLFLEIDKCLPGPDYGWEQRYVNALIYNIEDEEESQINLLGLEETKEMMQDPRVNAPGALEISQSIESTISLIRDSILINEFRLSIAEDNLLILKNIKNLVLQDFNIQKSLINNSLVLFNSDWNLLSTAQKETLLRIAITKGYYIGAGYTNNDGSINTSLAVQNDEYKVRSAVLSMAWDLWRTNTNPETKLSLREQFYAIQNNLSVPQLISLAETKYTQTKQKLSNLSTLGSDCLVLKAYTLGKTRGEIASAINIATNEEEKVFALAGIVDVFEPNTGSGIHYSNVSNARTDDSVLSFLESEYSFQNDGNDITLSVFNGFTVTGETARSNSILGFSSDTEKQEYFDTNYPDEDFPYSENKNKLSLKEIYKVDQIFANTSQIKPAGIRGNLFCRNAGGLTISNCWKDFYSASKLDYQIIVSGI